MQSTWRSQCSRAGRSTGSPPKFMVSNVETNPEQYSVAWYPIYRIPDSTLRAAFLTYHSLGHLVRRNPIYDSSVDTCIVSPVVGLQSYIAQESLMSSDYKFLRIDGTTKASDRAEIVKDFQEGRGAPIFLLTSQVSGLGLTLTKEDRVIVVDPAWNPSTDNQSVDRAYKIGQKKDVIVYRLMMCSTVEEKIYRKQVE
ncbi:Protein CHROMATIN REMODELING 24 [Forsythia ovata]|uniref:Protein CHROMATIN REMODELING 24 n=1 Tax=Forsythia ovata TaxID=205694 RepID=A0ABD1QN78_9LAMI